MPIVVWLAAAAVASSIPVAWWALAGERPVSQRVVDNLSTYQPTLREAVLQRSASERFLLPVVRVIGDRLVRFTPVGWMETKTTALARAGLTGRVTAEQVLGAKLVIPLLLGLLLGVRLLGEPSFRGLVLLVTCVGAGFVLPNVLVKAKADRRAEAITVALPDVLDQLTISVEAGLGFEAALERISEGGDGPLAHELGRMLQDVRLGASRLDALDAMASRSQVEDLRSVVLSLRQAEALGVTLAGTIRELARDMREKRRYRAEEKAHRLPTLMIFPLGLCILPALFIVILGPALITSYRLF